MTRAPAASRRGSPGGSRGILTSSGGYPTPPLPSDWAAFYTYFPVFPLDLERRMIAFEAFENLRITTQLLSMSDNFDFQIDQVIDQMHTKPLKVAPRPVQNIPVGPIE